MAWDDSIQSFDVDGVPAFFPGEATAARNAKIGLTDDLTLARISPKRQMLHMLHVANAAKQLARLPKQAETFHCIMRGNFNGWDLVPAVLRLAAPRTIARLHIATLGFNQQNASELLELLDAGQVGAVAFIASVYFRDSTNDVWSYLHTQLARRRQRAVAIRSHAKILLMELSDGTALVVESSANPRSCHNIEQFTMTHDRAVLEFHRGWMDQLITEATDAAGKKTETEKPKSPPRKPRKAPAAAAAGNKRSRAAEVSGASGGDRPPGVGASRGSTRAAKADTAGGARSTGRVRKRVAAMGGGGAGTQEARADR